MSQRRVPSRIAARVGLAGRRSVTFVSRPVISNAKYAKRESLPPHTPTPAVPFRAEEIQRRPIGAFAGLHPRTDPSSVHMVVVGPPAEIAASSSSAPPVRWGVYSTPPV